MTLQVSSTMLEVTYDHWAMSITFAGTTVRVHVAGKLVQLDNRDARWSPKKSDLQRLCKLVIDELQRRTAAELLAAKQPEIASYNDLEFTGWYRGRTGHT